MTQYINALQIAQARPASLLALIGSALAFDSLLAQEPGSVTIDVTRCVELESPEERLACYEAEVGDALGDSAAAAPARPRQPDSGSTRAESPARPGADASTAARPAIDSTRSLEPRAERTVRQLPVRQTDDLFGLRPRDDRDQEAPELLATVAELRERVPGEYIITLENGQVWRQVVPKRYRLRSGQRVRIYPSRWGSSYRLTAEELGGYVQVERVR